MMDNVSFAWVNAMDECQHNSQAYHSMGEGLEWYECRECREMIHTYIDSIGG